MGNTTKRGILCRMESALKHSPKKKGAILSLETMLYIGILIIFAAIGIGMYNQRDSAKAAAARTEMDQIRSTICTAIPSTRRLTSMHSSTSFLLTIRLMVSSMARS